MIPTDDIDQADSSPFPSFGLSIRSGVILSYARARLNSRLNEGSPYPLVSNIFRVPPVPMVRFT